MNSNKGGSGTLNGAYNALLFKTNMTSLEPLRGKGYHEDLKWRMVYQREMLGLIYQQIASNLNVHTSTSGELSRGLRKKAALMRERMKAPVSLQNQKSLPL